MRTWLETKHTAAPQSWQFQRIDDQFGRFCFAQWDQPLTGDGVLTFEFKGNFHSVDISPGENKFAAMWARSGGNAERWRTFKMTRKGNDLSFLAGGEEPAFGRSGLPAELPEDMYVRFNLQTRFGRGKFVNNVFHMPVINAAVGSSLTVKFSNLLGPTDASLRVLRRDEYQVVKITAAAGAEDILVPAGHAIAEPGRYTVGVVASTQGAPVVSEVSMELPDAKQLLAFDQREAQPKIGAMNDPVFALPLTMTYDMLMAEPMLRIRFKQPLEQALTGVALVGVDRYHVPSGPF